jgi:hypothetical protein
MQGCEPFPIIDRFVGSAHIAIGHEPRTIPLSGVGDGNAEQSYKVPILVDNSPRRRAVPRVTFMRG